MQIQMLLLAQTKQQLCSSFFTIDEILDSLMEELIDYHHKQNLGAHFPTTIDETKEAIT